MENVPTDFRRVTMVVNRMEPALAIYRDILGMKVQYDQETVMSGRSLPAAEPGARARLVILRCNHPEIGMLGLLQYLDDIPSEGGASSARSRLRAGDPVFVMQHENVEEAHRKIREIEGVQVIAEPRVTELARGDGGVLRVEAFSFFDPNGFFVELNQVVE